MTTTTDPLAKFRRAGQTPAKAPSSVAVSPIDASGGKEPYRAYSLSKDERRYLEIRLKYPESAEAQLNGMITSITGEWRMGLAMTLEYANKMVVRIRGERLTELFRALQDWKVEWIAEFDAQEHVQPKDGDAPFIESIVIETTRPEPLPPMEQRH